MRRGNKQKNLPKIRSIAVEPLISLSLIWEMRHLNQWVAQIGHSSGGCNGGHA
jgi:hypothetical protein